MTTTVKIEACLGDDKEVQVFLTEGEVVVSETILQNGENKTFYVHDDNEVSVKEVSKPGVE